MKDSFPEQSISTGNIAQAPVRANDNGAGRKPHIMPPASSWGEVANPVKTLEESTQKPDAPASVSRENAKEATDGASATFSSVGCPTQSLPQEVSTESPPKDSKLQLVSDDSPKQTESKENSNNDTEKRIDGVLATRPKDGGAGKKMHIMPPSIPPVNSDPVNSTEKSTAPMPTSDDPTSSSSNYTGKSIDGASVEKAKWFGTMTAIALLLGCMALFFAGAQFVVLAAALSSVPAPLQWVGWGGLLFLCVVVALSAFRLILLWRGLRPSMPLDWLSIRHDTTQKRKAAKEKLEEYLKNYAHVLDESHIHPDYGKLVDKETRKELRKGIRYLQTDEAKLSADWVGLFDKRFLNVLDRRVDAVIKARTKMVTYQSALAPGRALDTLLALYHTGCLLEDIARLYNQRMNRRQIPGALLRIVLQTGVVGNMEAATESFTEIAVDLGLPALEETVTAQLAKVASAKVGEALANYFFTYRLGCRIKNALRPLRDG